MSTLITNIGELVTNAPRPGEGAGTGVPPGRQRCQRRGAGHARRAWWPGPGPASRAPAADDVVDAGGRAVLPGFVDSHAHLVFAGERGAEFAARMAGAPYRRAASASPCAATRAPPTQNCAPACAAWRPRCSARAPPRSSASPATGSPSRTRPAALRLAAEVTPEVTYLGAHVVPPEFDGDAAGYVDLVCGPMLDACAPHARWVDVFCERGAFGADEARAVLAAGPRPRA